MAGVAFASTGLGLCHAVAHSLSARIGTVHGVALTVVLPHVLEFNQPACSEAYARIAEIMAVPQPEPLDRDGLGSAAGAVRALATHLGMPSTLRDLGCTDDLLPALVSDAIADDDQQHALADL